MESDAAPVRQSIASLCNLCIQSFNQLSKLLSSSDYKFADQLSQAALEDELGRFRVWVGNSGAHRSGRVSLDHRLREASHVHAKLAELLWDLKKALDEGEDDMQFLVKIFAYDIQAFEIIVNGGELEPPNTQKLDSDTASSSSGSSASSLNEFSGDSDEAEELPSTTDLEYAYLDISHIITCLYKFSIAVRRPAPRDRFHKFSAINMSHYEFFDIQHASHKFSQAPGYLTERMGKANTRRRQLLRYHKEHHGKIARYIDVSLDPQDEPEINPAKEGNELEVTVIQNQGSVRQGAPTISTLKKSQTTVTTVRQMHKELDAVDAESDTGQSQTSFAPSVASESQSTLQVPLPPRGEAAFDGPPFECPYCYSIIMVKSSYAWIKHVFKDLQPYICTFEHCPKSVQLFERRNDWYDHEVQFHRREWYCDDCKESFHFKGDFKDHLKTDHGNLFSESELTAAINRCERASFDDQPCPICQSLQKYSPTHLRSHLARHMQQLALFTLPSLCGETADEVESNGAQPSADIEDENSVDFSEHSNLSFDSNPSRSGEEEQEDTLKRDETHVESIDTQPPADTEEDLIKRDETHVESIDTQPPADTEEDLIKRDETQVESISAQPSADTDGEDSMHTSRPSDLSVDPNPSLSSEDEEPIKRDEIQVESKDVQPSADMGGEYSVDSSGPSDLSTDPLRSSADETQDIPAVLEPWSYREKRRFGMIKARRIGRIQTQDIVLSEKESGSVLFQHKILRKHKYDKYIHDWSDVLHLPKRNSVEISVDFDNKEDCMAIWKFIEHVQPLIPEDGMIQRAPRTMIPFRISSASNTPLTDEIPPDGKDDSPISPTGSSTEDPEVPTDEEATVQLEPDASASLADPVVNETQAADSPAVSEPWATPRNVKIWNRTDITHWNPIDTGYCTGLMLNDKPYLQVLSGNKESGNFLLQAKILRKDEYKIFSGCELRWERSGVKMSMDFENEKEITAIWKFIEHVQPLIPEDDEISSENEIYPSVPPTARRIEYLDDSIGEETMVQEEPSRSNSPLTDEIPPGDKGDAPISSLTGGSTEEPGEPADEETTIQPESSSQHSEE
ncbi:hypothetical protein K440DRAFT_660426 [Wilcoxina mikolae CBS 423.85]|nr:hypothetical protein K440DRAFT_660426 [Wilcoxina mikolae CBS 423.85]